MRTIGFPWDSWESHGNGNRNAGLPAYGNGNTDTGMGILTVGMGMSFHAKWQSIAV